MINKATLLGLQIISIFHGCMVWIEKICHEDQWSASRGLPRAAEQWSRVADDDGDSDPEWRMFLSTPYTHDRYFFLRTFWFTIFDFQSRTC